MVPRDETVPPLFHVTTADSAAAIRDDGYATADWMAQGEAWGLDPTAPETWAEPDVHPSIVATALAEHALEAERLAGHPSRSPAAFFYTNPSMARYAMQSLDIGDRCVVVDPTGIDAPVAQAPLSTLQPLFWTVQQAVEAGTALEHQRLGNQSTEYWRHVVQWTGNTNPRIEVFVATDHVASDYVIDVVGAAELRQRARDGSYEQHPNNDGPYATAY